VACLIELSYIERIDLVEFWQYFYKVSGYQILPSDQQPKLHLKFELAQLHYLIHLRCFMGAALLNFLLGFASISRVSHCP